MKLKVFIIFILISVTAASYIFSDEIFRFYTNIYYTYVKKTDYNKMIKEAKTLFKNKKYKLLKGRLEIMETLYSNNVEIKRIKGMNSIKLGQDVEGALMIVSTLDNGIINSNMLTEAAGILFKNELYGDIITIYRNYNYLNNRKLIFYYGISFYKKADYRAALNMLNRINGFDGINFTDHDKSLLYYYKGASCAKLEMLQKALEYIKYSWELDKRNILTRKILISIYRKLKKYKEAEIILRLK